MKKLPLVVLTLFTLPAYAQSVLGSLNQYQGSLKVPSAAGTATSTPQVEVKAGGEAVSSSSKKCEENDQTSLPLAYVTSLILQKNAALDITHDPRTGDLSISSADMIGNCSSMLEWKLKEPEIKGQKAYAIEVKIKEGENCSAEGCSYKVAKVKNGEFQSHEPMVLKPTLKGFEQCLQNSGVIVNGKVDSGAIYNTPVNEKFSGIDQSGKLLFLAHGPSSPLVKAKYGKFEHVDACDYYEVAHPKVTSLLTLEDAQKEQLDAEASKLKDCKVDEYGKLAEFIEKYENYSYELGTIRDNLILQAAAKSAENISKGKYTDEDLKVLADFERYIVNPKVENAVALYEEMTELEGDAMKAKQEELKLVLAEISSLNKKPYFLSSHTQKLIADGKFEEAEKMNSFKLVLGTYQRLGAKQDNVVITPEIAAKRVASSQQAFATALVQERENYEIRTGQVSGKSDYYSALAKRMRENIQIRNQNFMQEIQSEYARIQQPNGYCYRYFRNTQKCIQDTVERVQELQALLQHYTKVDAERAAEYDEKAKEYGKLEAEGRRYIAAQSGEVVEDEEPAPAEVEAPADTTRPAPRASNGNYTFEYPGNGAQASVQPNMTMKQPQGYQQPWLGQQSYPMPGQYGQNPMAQSGYSFNWSAGMGAQNQMGMYGQQPNPYQYNQQQGYWQQPYQAYGMYSMYGR